MKSEVLKAIRLNKAVIGQHKDTENKVHECALHFQGMAEYEDKPFTLRFSTPAHFSVPIGPCNIPKNQTIKKMTIGTMLLHCEPRIL